MRRFLSRPVLLSLLLLSCSGHHEAVRLMDTAESLMSESPDSAMALMQQVPREQLHGRASRARYALLMTMAQDKCYIEVQEDSLIRTAYDFYRRRGNRAQRLRSGYYLAVVHQNAGRYLEAARELREAEHLAEKTGDEHHLGLICWHLNDIFAANYDHVRALEYAEKALQAYERSGERIYIEYSKLEIANRLMAHHRNDEADELLQGIMDDHPEDDILYSEASLTLARSLLLRKVPDYKRAATCMEAVVERQAIALTAQNYGYLAIINEVEGNRKRAEEYLEMEKSMARSAADSAIFYDIAQDVYDLRRDTSAAYVALLEAVKIQNRIITRQLEQSVSHSIETYYQNDLLLEREKTRSRLYLSILTGGVLIAVILWLAVLLRKGKRKSLEDMAAVQEVYASMEAQRAKDTAVAEVMDQFIKDKIQSLQQLSTTYFSWDDEQVKKRKDRCGWESQDEIINAFRNQVGALRNDQAFIPALEQALDLSDDGLMARVRQAFPRMDETDFKLLTLLFSGFPVKSICYLLRMSDPAVRMRKTRYKQLFTSLASDLGPVLVEKLG